jgi:hypothetical protein
LDGALQDGVSGAGLRAGSFIGRLSADELRRVGAGLEVLEERLPAFDVRHQGAEHGGKVVRAGNVRRGELFPGRDQIV